MPSFAAPLYLLLLLTLPLIVWLHQRQRRRALPHPGLALFAGLPIRQAWLARRGSLVLRVLALTALTLALAGPRWPDLRTRLDTEGIALFMVVDVSGSMGERDLEYQGQRLTRLEAAQRVFRLFVLGNASGDVPPESSRGPTFEGRPTDLIGLVCFATRPEATCPLTLSHSALLRLLEAEQPRGVPGESETNLSDALALALARLRAAGPRRKVLVLLTDGEHNQQETRSGWTPRQVGQLAASLGIPIYTIDAGPKVWSDTPQTEAAGARRQAAETLQALAQMTHGQAFHANDGAALVAACRSIDRAERTTIASYQYRRYHEAYPWCGLASFALFVLAIALERTVWRRLP